MSLALRHARRGELRLLHWAAAALGAALVLFAAARHITAAPIDRDSGQSLLMAVNLAHHGVMSLEETAPFTPSDYREPIPIALLAATVWGMDRVLGVAPTESYFHGERLRYAKCQNLLWLVLLYLGVFCCIHVTTRSFYASLAGALLAALLFSGAILNDLLTDTAAAAILALASAAFAAGLTRASVGLCVAAGLLFGVLVLIKAAVLYVLLGVLGLLIAIALLWHARLAAQALGTRIAILGLSCLVVVAPWMLRNRVELGTFQVTQRAGVVLMVRALKDLMTPEEYLGTFYVWSPKALRPAIGRLLGFGPRDLQRGGRLQHLNRSETSDFAGSDLAAERAGRPEDAVSYYRRGRAERARLEQQLAAAGAPNADIQADRLLGQHAMRLIEAHPLRHLLLTIPFLWRGAAVTFPVLLIALWLGIRTERYDCALLALPAFGLVMFYALLSHFIPRYGMPMAPIAIAVVVTGVTLAARAWWRRA